MSGKSMEVAVLTGRMRMEVRSEPVPELPPGGMILKVHSCGICGSDVNRFRFSDSTEPKVLGHEVAGEVVRAADSLTKFDVGDRVVVGHVHVPCMHCVYCRNDNYSMCRQFKESSIIPGGYAEYVAVPADQAMHTVLRIPEGMTYDEATFVDPIACCWRALRRCGAGPMSRVAVVGVGTMGLLFVQLLRSVGATSFALDIAGGRLEQAAELGADHVFDPRDAETVRSILSATDGMGVDVAVLTVVNADTIGKALDYVRDGGTLCVFAPPLKQTELELDFFSVFRRELDVVGSYSSSPFDLEPALECIQGERVNVRSLITGYTDIEGIEDAMRSIDEDTYKIIVHP